MAQLYYVNAAGSYNSNTGFHSDGWDPLRVTTIMYPAHDEGIATPESSCNYSQQQFRVDPFLAAGGIPLSFLEHSGSCSTNQNYN
jgi:hypothetical protein